MQAFVFVGIPTAHCDVPPDRSKSGVVYEIRAIPGNLIGVGSTPKRALESLADLLSWTFEDAGSEAAIDNWYEDAWKLADETDLANFGRVLTERYRLRREPQRREDGAPYELLTASA